MILGTGLFAFQNCAPTQFAQDDGLNKGEVCVVTATEDCKEDPLNPNATPTPGTTPTPTPGTTPTPGSTPTPTPTPGTTPTPAGEVFPKMIVTAPNCLANTMCPVTFALDKGYSKALSFNWRTHDTSYQTNPMHGQPGVHYVASSGVINFGVNETSKTIYIQSLNINMNIKIPFQWYNCVYGGAALDCSVLR